jgi:hypothetical protein
VVNNLGVDVTINSIGALLTVLFIEESDRYIGKGHLFKRSILLIKAWALHESASYTGQNAPSLPSLPLLFVVALLLV